MVDIDVMQVVAAGLLVACIYQIFKIGEEEEKK